MMNDITQLRKLENIRKEFVSNVSHELKTPITAIMGFVETLKNIDNNNEDQKKFLQNFIFFETRNSDLLIYIFVFHFVQ